MTTKTFLTGLQSLTLVAAVLLSGVHAKDVVRSQAPASSKSYAVAKTHGDDSSSHKIGSELHNHIDKQTLKTFKYSNTNAAHHTDRRSLALLDREIQSLKMKLKLGWAMRWQLAFAKIML